QRINLHLQIRYVPLTDEGFYSLGIVGYSCLHPCSIVVFDDRGQCLEQFISLYIGYGRQRDRIISPIIQTQKIIVPTHFSAWTNYRAFQYTKWMSPQNGTVTTQID